MLAGEAMEVLGGNGYVEDSGMPRIYREMPVNSIWEGSGNVMCLDVLRAVTRTPGSLDAVIAEWRDAGGADRRFDRFCAKLEADFIRHPPAESEARRLVERLVLAVQGALLLRHASDGVADAFCASRIEGDWGGAFGTLPGGIDAGAIARAAAPLGAG
jgi:putative acyl-CoA dehydrogenase